MSFNGLPLCSCFTDSSVPAICADISIVCWLGERLLLQMFPPELQPLSETDRKTCTFYSLLIHIWILLFTSASGAGHVITGGFFLAVCPGFGFNSSRRSDNIYCYTTGAD